jgi:hypothetical protein
MLIVDSGTGLIVAITRQNAGRSANGEAALVACATGEVNSPAGIVFALLIVVFDSAVDARLSHEVFIA